MISHKYSIHIKLFALLFIVFLLGLGLSGCGTTPQKETYNISGTILNTEGDGIEGVVLHFDSDTETSTTDEDGRWSKSGLEGTVTVTPNKEDWVFEPKSRKVSGEANDVDFTGSQVEVGEKFSLSGQVLDKYGNEMEGVNISFSSGFGSTLTDEDGNWSETEFYGTVEVSATKEGYSFAPGLYQATESKENVDFVGAQLEEGQTGIKYYEETKIMTKTEAENIEEISPDKDIIVFEEKTPFLANLKVGDVLVVLEELPGAEEGLMKIITSISSDGKTLEVIPATLEDVIREGEIYSSQVFTIEYMMKNIEFSEGVRVLDVDQQRSSYPIIWEPIEGVMVEGEIRFTQDANVELPSIFREGLKFFEFSFTPGFEKSFTVTVEKGVGWEEDMEIAKIPGSSIPIYGPITITPEIRLVVGTKGTISGKFETGFDYERSYRTGLRYERNSGWEQIFEESGSGFDLREPVLEGDAETLIYAGPELYGFAGVRAVGEAGLGATLYGNIEASGSIIILPSWLWQYEMNMFMSLGLSAELRLLRIASIGWSSPSYDFYHTNIAYGASGRVTDGEGNGVSGVTIYFSGGGDFESVTTNEDGYWYKHLLNNTVTVTPDKAGFVFEPSYKNISGGSSTVNFVGMKEEEENDFFRYSDDYMGWVDGARLEYKSRYGENVGWGEWDISFMETKYGVDIFEVEQEGTNGESYTDIFYFVRKGLEYYVFFDEDDIFNGDGFNKENGLFWIEKPISKGDFGFELFPDYPLLLEAKEIEYIETEAGVFKAWRFYVEEEYEFDGEIEIIEINFWFVPFLGFVKYEASDSSGVYDILELIDFSFN